MKRKIVFTLIFCFLSNWAVFSQQLWLKSYSKSSDVVFNSFTLTSDGGMVLTGYTQIFTSPTFREDEEIQSDLLITKLNSLGEIELQKTYGSTGSDIGYSVIESTKGGYVVAGETTSFGASSTDGFVLRVDETGNVLWAKIIDGGSEDWAVDIKETEKGSYIALGTTKKSGGDNSASNYDIFLIGIDNDGKVLWQKQYDGGGDDVGYCLLKTSAGDFIVGGATTSKGNGDYDTLVMKSDAGGVLKWQKIFGTNNDDYGYYVTESKDGGFLLVGETFLKDKKNRMGYSNAYVVRINSFGGDEWQKSYGFAKNNFALSAKPMGKQGFVIGGGSKASAESFSSWTFKIDWSGKIIWKTGYDFSGNESIYCAKPTKDGYLSILGVVNSGENVYSFLTKSDKEGKIPNCSYVTESSISNKKGSFGSGTISLSTKIGSPTVKGVTPSVSTKQDDLSNENLCE